MYKKNVYMYPLPHSYSDCPIAWGGGVVANSGQLWQPWEGNRWRTILTWNIRELLLPRVLDCLQHRNI